MKFSFSKETDLCTNCWKHKAVVSNITYQSFDKDFKFYPVCVDCFDIDEFNESTSRFIRQGHFLENGYQEKGLKYFLKIRIIHY